MELSPQAILIFISGILIFSLDIVILIGSRTRSSRFFVIFTFITGVWVVSQAILISTYSNGLADFLIRFQHVLGLIVAINFYLFSQIYPSDRRIPRRTSIILGGIVALAFYFYFFSGLLVTTTEYIGGIGRWAWHFGNLNIVFIVTFATLWTIGLKKILDESKRFVGYQRQSIRMMFWALFLGIIPPTLCNIVLPIGSVYEFNWIGPIASTIWVFMVAYSIIRYQQMDVRAIATEVLAIAMAIIFFINIFADTPLGPWDNLLEFIIFLVLAIYLIRGVLREAKQREQLNELNRNLEEKVTIQTIEVRRSLESEKRTRMELEKLNDAKDQFIMITQHHLRTPVSSIIWALDSSLSGAYGAVVPGLRSVLEEMQTSCKRLMRIVDDFLNITAIKVGTSILDIHPTSLKPAIDDILTELKSPIAEMGLGISYPQDISAWPPLRVDYNKIRECLFVVFENAVRYNTKGGTISVSTSISNRNFSIRVENTGIGISKEESNRIGSALFYRGEYARKAYPIGMGIGLSVVKSIIQAHHGTFSISSKGKNQGATVIIGLLLGA